MNRNRKVHDVIWDKIIRFLHLIFYNLAHVGWQWWQTEILRWHHGIEVLQHGHHQVWGAVGVKCPSGLWQLTDSRRDVFSHVKVAELVVTESESGRLWLGCRYDKRGNLRIAGDGESTGRKCSDGLNHDWRKLTCPPIHHCLISAIKEGDAGLKSWLTKSSEVKSIYIANFIKQHKANVFKRRKTRHNGSSIDISFIKEIRTI